MSLRYKLFQIGKDVPFHEVTGSNHVEQEFDALVNVLKAMLAAEIPIRIDLQLEYIVD